MGEVAILEIVNLEGQKLYTSFWSLNQGDNSVSFSAKELGLYSGLYIVRISCSSGNSFGKVLIFKLKITEMIDNLFLQAIRMV